MPSPSKSKMKYAVAVAAPVVAVVIGAMLKAKKAKPKTGEHSTNEPVPPAATENDRGGPPRKD
jgi:hypothetical protein